FQHDRVACAILIAQYIYAGRKMSWGYSSPTNVLMHFPFWSYLQNDHLKFISEEIILNFSCFLLKMILYLEHQE
ncbi:MAG: hypothetical protein ONB05_02170, partial [candidate division KSB1 bacterium]|nr:hypothetical protein [candidate division KSB1 bacterium]